MTSQPADLILVLESDDSSRAALARELSSRLDAPLVHADQVSDEREGALRLVVRDDAIELREASMKPRRGMTIDFASLDLRTGSGGLSRKQPIARAFGEKVNTIIDATAGTGQDAALLAALGYQVTAIERSAVLFEMLDDAFTRAMRDATFARAIGDRLRFVHGDAREMLPELAAPDAVYVDPMFPPKKRASALPRKEIQLLRRLVGDDDDAAELFDMAKRTARKRVVVKRPSHAPPLGREPSLTFQGKLVRYDVYLIT
jgi:16S rRNA (guanine1516-N2)-methyltransferase